MERTFYEAVIRLGMYTAVCDMQAGCPQSLLTAKYYLGFRDMKEIIVIYKDYSSLKTLP